MNIRELNPADDQEYIRLAASHGSVFDTPAWSRQFGERIRNYGIFDAAGKLVGGFYLYVNRKYGLPIYFNPPFTPTTGLFFKSESTNPVRVLDKHKQVISLVADFIDKMNYSVVSLSFDKKLVDMQPFIWRSFKVIPHYTYIIHLDLPEETLWKRMSNEIRNHITKAAKDGLVIKQCGDYSIVRTLVLKTFARQRKGIGIPDMNTILFGYANAYNSFAFVAFNNDDPIACAFYVHDGKTAYCLLAGYDSEKKHHGAGASCQWEAIKHSRRLGLQHFDFEGSMIPAIERYFRGFGGELTPYYRINKAKLPLEIALKFLKRELF